MNDTQILITLRQLVELTGLSESTLRREAAAGKLRVTRIRRRLCFLGAHVSEWLRDAELPPAVPVRIVRHRVTEPMTRLDAATHSQEMREFVRGEHTRRGN